MLRCVFLPAFSLFICARADWCFVCFQDPDVLSLSMLDTDLYTCCANGWIQRWNAQFVCTASWKAHEGIILSSIIASTCTSTTSPRLLEDGEAECVDSEKEKGWYLVTGANDNDIKIWSIPLPHHPHHPYSSHHTLSTSRHSPYSSSTSLSHPSHIHPGHLATSEYHDPLIQSLSTFVSFPSVSNSVAHREDCRQAAMWLRRYLGGLGAGARMVSIFFFAFPVSIPSPFLFPPSSSFLFRAISQADASLDRNKTRLQPPRSRHFQRRHSPPRGGDPSSACLVLWALRCDFGAEERVEY